MIDTLLRFFLSMEGMAVALAWTVLLTRFAIILWRELEGSGSASRLTWLMWALFLLIVMAGTMHHPMVVQFIGSRTEEWLGKLPRVVFAVLAYLMTVSICYEFAPSTRPKRWNWPPVIGLLLIFVYGVILRLTSLGEGAFPRSPEFYSEFAADPLFHFYLLLIAARVVLPALTSARQQEKQTPMRLRFMLMAVTHVAVVVWMVNEVIYGLSQVLSFHYAKEGVYRVALTSFLLSFLFSYFMPAKHFVILVQAGQYIGDLIDLALIRRLQLRITRLTDGRRPPLDTVQSLKAPGMMVYLGVIDILDQRKKLQGQPDGKARELGSRVSRAATTDYSYQEVLRELRRASWETWLTDHPVGTYLTRWGIVDV